MSQPNIVSRSNGARTRGPNTREDKKSSSMDALFSQCVVLPDESHRIFDALLDQYLSRLDPADSAAHAVVDEMVAAVLHRRNLLAVETRLVSMSAAGCHETGEWDRIAAAFSELLRRYGRLHRVYRRTLQSLSLLRDSHSLRNHDSGPQPQNDQTKDYDCWQSPQEMKIGEAFFSLGV